MAIAIDTSLDGGVSALGTITISYTATGANLAVVVCLAHSPLATISGITWNGVALTQAGIQVNSNNTTACELWYLLGAGSGTHNVVITVSVGVGTNIYSKIASYSGVSASGADASATNSQDIGNAPYLTNVTTVADNDWLVMSHNSPGAGNPSSANGTVRIDGASGLGDLVDRGPVSPAGATNLSIEVDFFGPNFQNCSALVALKPDIPVAFTGGGPMGERPAIAYLDYAIPC